MTFSLGRATRPFLATAGVAVALTATGCVEIERESAQQRDVIGDVGVTTEQCFEGGFGSARQSEGPCARTVQVPQLADLSGDERRILAAAKRQERGPGTGGQFLLAYKIPNSSKAPDTITATAEVDDAEDVVRGTTQYSFVYRASESYASALEQTSDSGPDKRWVGYLSDPQGSDAPVFAAWKSTVHFTLPTTEAGRPYQGPFPYRTVVGLRLASSSKGDATRPVTCDAGGDATLCQTSSNDEQIATRGTNLSDGRTTPTRDLALAAAGGPVNITAGTGGDVPFVLRFAGDASGDPFTLTSAATAGAAATPGQPLWTPSANQESTIPVRVTVPSGTPAGLQTVELVASLSNGQSRKATAQFNVVPAVTASVPILSAAKCTSRRSFTIRLRQRKRDPLVSAVVRVNGKKVKTVKRSRITAPVRLTGLPKGRFTVRITAKTRSGKTVSGARRYKTCVPKEKGGIPQL
jgi:hypothetical protein